MPVPDYEPESYHISDVEHVHRILQDLHAQYVCDKIYGISDERLSIRQAVSWHYWNRMTLEHRESIRTNMLYDLVRECVRRKIWIDFPRERRVPMGDLIYIEVYGAVRRIPKLVEKDESSFALARERYWEERLMSGPAVWGGQGVGMNQDETTGREVTSVNDPEKDDDDDNGGDGGGVLNGS